MRVGDDQKPKGTEITYSKLDFQVAGLKDPATTASFVTPHKCLKGSVGIHLRWHQGLTLTVTVFKNLQLNGLFFYDNLL